MTTWTIGNEEASAQGTKSAAPVQEPPAAKTPPAAVPVSGKPPAASWLIAAAKAAFQAFLYVAAVVGIWLAVMHFGIIDEGIAGSVTLVLGVLLFLLALPVSAVFHLDQVMLGQTDNSRALLIALCFVLLNFELIGIAGKAYRRWRHKLVQPD